MGPHSQHACMVLMSSVFVGGPVHTLGTERSRQEITSEPEDHWELLAWAFPPILKGWASLQMSPRALASHAEGMRLCPVPATPDLACASILPVSGGHRLEPLQEPLRLWRIGCPLVRGEQLPYLLWWLYPTRVMPNNTWTSTN